MSIPPDESSSSILVDIDEDPNIGRVLNGRYRLESRLGVGGYGIVYEGVYLKDEQKVAIKMLRPAEDHDQEVRARFRREGEALSNLESKHTVRTYEFNYDEEGSMFIVMELLHGRTLKDELRKLGRLPWRRGLNILMQICDALTEAHASGYVHRDLKPENIYLCTQPEGQDHAKVLDFGIAKKLQLQGHQQDGDTQLTAHGQTVGTMRYMSPEQLLGQNIDSRSDIYSLGVLTCRMLTGRVPFPKAKNMARLIAAQLQQTPKLLSQMYSKANFPEDVDLLVSLMLEKTAAMRLPNTEVLRIACSEILEGGDWISADRYRKKSAKDEEEEDDPTAKAAAVNPMEIASMLDPEAQAELASITGHNLPSPVSQPGYFPNDVEDTIRAPQDITDRTATVDVVNNPDPIQFSTDIDLDDLSVKTGSTGLWFLLFVMLVSAGVVVYFLVAR